MTQVVERKFRIDPAARLDLLQRVPPEQASEPGIRSMLLQALVAAGEHGRALAVAETLAGDPKASDAQREYALRERLWLLFQARRSQDVVDALAGQPQDTTARLAPISARAYLDLGLRDAARELVLVALRAAPGDPDLLTLLARACDPDDPAPLHREARRGLDAGERNAAVLAAWIQAGRALGDDDARAAAVRCLSWVGHWRSSEDRRLAATDPAAVHAMIMSAPDLAAAPPQFSAVHARRLRLSPGPLRDAVSGVLETAAEKAGQLASMAGCSELLGPPPDAILIDAWATVYGEGGVETPHIHPLGWFSGVYYPARSCVSRVSGTLCFGFPPAGRLPGPFDVMAEVDPEPGMLVVFPSLLPHWTNSPGRGSERVSVAFDLCPSDDEPA